MPWLTRQELDFQQRLETRILRAKPLLVLLQQAFVQVQQAPL